MTRILRSTDSNNASSASITEAQFQAQAAAQVDALRQLVGNADLVSGSTFTNPLNSPITLYVDPNIGRDDWEGGSYNTNAASRIDNQHLVCGYSPNRPFRTLNRAVIEAAILTSKSYLSTTGDLVTIFCAPGQHTLLNGAGDADTTDITNWGTSKADTNNAAWNTLLTRFNDPQWGVILPRGVTICGWDLRKTVIRPAVVPSASGKIRRRMLRVTSDCYFFGFTFKDAIGVTTSHHNLACFGFAGETALDLFYSKIRAAFPNASTSSNLDDAKAVTLGKEFQIVGPQPDVPTSDSDTTNGSSPYIFNCSLRSTYGLSGIDLDGSLVTGLKSLVTAQFTNVSLQKDIAALQKYSDGNWAAVADYADYINTDINDVRFKVDDTDDYRHFALRCSNGAFMQAVSIFAIGNAVHHWCESGGEITLTNSNSNFGSQASLAVGFRGQGKSGGAFPQDTNFTAAYIRRPKAIPTDGSNIRKLFLGTVSSISTTGITLSTSLDYAGLVTRNGYSLKENDLIWIENNNTSVLDGADFRAQLGASPWSSDTPTEITVKNNGSSNFDETGVSDAAVGNRVYIRRLVDNRTPEQRETSFIVQNTGTHRRPVGSYVVRLDRNGSLDSAAGADQLDPVNGGGEVFLVGDALRVTQAKDGSALTTSSYKVLPISGDSQRTFSTSSDNYYRTAEVVVYNNRYYRCLTTHTATTFDSSLWIPTLSNIPVSASAGGIEAVRANIAPTIILDGDTDTSDTSTTLGWDFTVTGSTTLLNQLRSASDYRALKNLMLKLGYAAGTGASQVDGILHPTTEANRDYSIASGATPSGGKLSGRNPWPIEFSRYSVVRAYGLAYEWVGYGNYTKALPKYQISRLSDQQGLDVLAANVSGGRCFNQGTTEEGLVVTPFVVQDLGTGREFRTETAGLGGISGDVEFPSAFADLEVTGTLTAATYANLPIASTSRQGIVELATDAEASSAQDSNRALTPRGLGQWANAKKVVFRTTSTQRIFIGTWNNGTDDISPVGYDTTYRDSYWPAPSNATNNNKPEAATFKPFSTFAAAASWCNEFLGIEQTAELVVKPGFYNITGVTFNCKILLNGASTGTTSSVTSGVIGTYSIDAGAEDDSVFLCNLPSLKKIGTDYPQYVSNRGLTLSNGGTINLVHFPSIDMMLGATQIPDNWFTGSTWRNSDVKSAAAGTRVVEWFRQFYIAEDTELPASQLSTATNGITIYATGGYTELYACTFGARKDTVYIDVSNAQLRIYGCRLRGNEYWDFSTPGVASVQVCGHSNYFLRFSGNCTLSLGRYQNLTTATGYLANINSRHIHLERLYFGTDSRGGDSDPAAPSAGDSTPFNDTDANKTARGPIVAYFIGLPNGGSLTFPDYDCWYNAANTFFPGFNGKFGTQNGGALCYLSHLGPGSRLSYGTQYYNKGLVIAGTGATSETATSATPKSATLGASDLVVTDADYIITSSALNAKAVRYTNGIYYELGITVNNTSLSHRTIGTYF